MKALIFFVAAALWLTVAIGCNDGNSSPEANPKNAKVNVVFTDASEGNEGLGVMWGSGYVWPVISETLGYPLFEGEVAAPGHFSSESLSQNLRAYLDFSEFADFLKEPKSAEVFLICQPIDSQEKLKSSQLCRVNSDHPCPFDSKNWPKAVIEFPNPWKLFDATCVPNGKQALEIVFLDGDKSVRFALNADLKFNSKEGQ